MKHPQFLRLLLTLTAGLLLLPVKVQASAELVLQMESSLRYDSNPLRFTQEADVLTALGSVKKGDSVQANDVRLSVAYPLGSPETRLVFGGQLGHRNYTQMTWLDHTEYAYRAGLEWRLSPLWRGVLLHSQDQKLFDYLDGTLTTRELAHRTTDNIDIALRITPDLELPLSVTKKHLTYDSVNNLANESEEQSMDMALSLRSETGSRLRVGLRSTDARFPHRTAVQIANLDYLYRDDEIYLETDWKYSDKTRFGGRVASLRRGYETLSALSFSAATAELTLDHDYSPKTKIGFSAWSRPAGSTSAATLYSTIHGAQWVLRWQATAKTRLSLQAAKESERYQTTSAWVGLPNPVTSRVSFGGGVVYAFSRDLSLYVEGSKDDLNRGTLGADISQHTLRAGLMYNFENLSGLAMRAGLGAHR